MMHNVLQARLILCTGWPIKHPLELFAVSVPKLHQRWSLLQQSLFSVYFCVDVSQAVENAIDIFENKKKIIVTYKENRNLGWI